MRVAKIPKTCSHLLYLNADPNPKKFNKYAEFTYNFKWNNFVNRAFTH